MRVVSFILASVANECLSITCKHITCTLRMQFESRRSVWSTKLYRGYVYLKTFQSEKVLTYKGLTYTRKNVYTVVAWWRTWPPSREANVEKRGPTIPEKIGGATRGHMLFRTICRVFTRLCHGSESGRRCDETGEKEGHRYDQRNKGSTTTRYASTTLPLLSFPPRAHAFSLSLSLSLSVLSHRRNNKVVAHISGLRENALCRRVFSTEIPAERYYERVRV